MRMHALRVTIALTVVFVPSRAAAQHEGHQLPAPAAAAEMAQCAQVQPAVQHIIDAAMARLESARQSNSAADMRAAIDSLEGALRDIRTQLAPCASAAAAPHQGHGTPAGTGAAAPAASPPAADSHAGHQVPATQPAPSAPPQPSAPKSARTPAPVGKHLDPVNGLIVDPETAPKTTYQGQTYYFSSEGSRKEFLQNPGKFAKKPNP